MVVAQDEDAVSRSVVEDHDRVEYDASGAEEAVGAAGQSAEHRRDARRLQHAIGSEVTCKVTKFSST